MYVIYDTKTHIMRFYENKNHIICTLINCYIQRESEGILFTNGNSSVWIPFVCPIIYKG